MAPALVENVSHTAANSEQMRAFIKKIFAEPDWNELFSFFFFSFLSLTWRLPMFIS